jgi:alpha-amylase/alpha-mannosidase (GH57 family)
MNSKYICIHGHFYQPPRENPWLETIEIQDSAYPYHDWNARVAAESYAPNTASRIMNADMRIIDIVNNYSKISFNFGPTLMWWLEPARPDIYHSTLEADSEAAKQFSGHGPAIAQAFNHIIMPLANSRDKYTQVVWAIADFKHRFGRKPEGMWLPETAVDLETLDIMAAKGIKFTILAPHQAKRVRKIRDRQWNDVSDSRIDPKMPYRCRLPSGKSIALFFYDGPIAHDVGFGNLLDNGEAFAERLLSVFDQNGEEPQLVHIATDGETYGHHHRWGDMALAYCLYKIEADNAAKVTVYGEYLEKFPPTHEVEIFENSSWSCVHGVERWRNDCGCNTGGHPDWNQAWRAPLRGAFDWLQENLIQIYEAQSKGLLKDPWKARDNYIKVILNRSEKNIGAFLTKHATRELSQADKIKVLRLLEMQRNAMMLYTSCAWFFDEISGIETTQVLNYGARAIQLAFDVSGIWLEDAFVSLLERAPSNIAEIKNGAEVYRRYVQPSVLDLRRVAIHYGISSLFWDYEDEAEIYTYRIKRHSYERQKLGNMKLALGVVSVKSEITWAQQDISFAVLHLGDHNIIGGARGFTDEETFRQMAADLKECFGRSDVPEAVRALDSHFKEHNISLWHLFRDEQQNILQEIFRDTLKEIENSLRRIYGRLSSVMQALQQGGRMRMPKYFSMILEFLLETDIRRCLESEEINFTEMENLAEQARQWSLNLDRLTLGYIASQRINRLMEEWAKNPEDAMLLEMITRVIATCQKLGLELNLWKAQTIYFFKGREELGKMRQRLAETSDENAQRWIDSFKTLGDYQRVKVE